MKTSDALKMAGIVFAGVAAYLVVTRAAKAGEKVTDAVVNTIKKDLNPTSPENVVYRNLPETLQEKIGNALGSIFDPDGYAVYTANKKAIDGMMAGDGGASNTKKQADALVPDDNQSSAEVARLKRQAANSSYVNPFKPEGSW